MTNVIRTARLAAMAVRPGASTASQQFYMRSMGPSTALPFAVHRRCVSQHTADDPDLEGLENAEDDKQLAFRVFPPRDKAPFTVNFHKSVFSFNPKDGNPKGAMKRNKRIWSTWLRDNCRCSKCVNQDTLQRNFKIFNDLSVTPQEIKTDEFGLKVIWSPDSHQSFYEWDFIKRYLYESTRSIPDRKHHLWGSEIATSPPTMTYEEVMDDKSDNGLAILTDNIMRFGFVFVDNTPFDDPIHTKKLLERIGPIRETHYGGFYDFVPDMAKADTAYTNIALPAHTDTTYFTDPAGLQAFHLLSHTPPPDAPVGEVASGGESLLVDGFNAASILETESPRFFPILNSYPVPWHASGNKGINISSDQMFPVLEMAANPQKLKPSPIFRVRWNNDDRGVVPLARSNDFTRRWYLAAAKWDQIIRRDSSEFWFQLKPGRTLIFDNYRVLHGRSAFTGLRRICGGYINRDDFMSRWRNTNLDPAKVLAQTMG